MSSRRVAAAVLLLALLLRVWDVGARSLWFDEAGEYWVATSSLSELPAAVRDGSGDPPLFTLLLHAWMQLSENDTWLRLLSVLFSLAGAAGAMALARRLGGPRAGLAAGLLVAVSAADIRYAQEVGQYALMAGALYWSLFALTRVAEAPDRRSWTLWVAAALAASHAYYGAALAVLVPFACVVLRWAWHRDRTRVRDALLALGAYTVGMLPLLYVLPAQLSRVVALEGPGTSSAPPGVFALAGWLQQPLSFPLTGWPFTPVPSWVSAPLVLVMLALGMRAHRRPAVWFGATWLASLIADQAGLFPYGFRWGLIASPLLVTLLAAGAFVGGRDRRVARAATVGFAGLVAMSLVSLPHRNVRERFFSEAKWSWPETEDVEPMADLWRMHRTPQQPTYVYYGAAPAFAYYVSRAERALGERPPTWHLSCWHDGTAGYCRSNGVYYGRWLRGLDRQQRLLSIFTSFRGEPREFWIVFGHIQPGEDTELLSTLVVAGYEIVSAAQAKDAALFLVRRR
jgi:hypothetical protein